MLFAHPYYEHSTANVQLIDCYRNNPNITFRDLYEDYPDFHIQPFRERKRIVNYERLIFHFPLIWFGMPPLLKLWIDEVFDMKWLSHDSENPLIGKEAVIVVTAGGSEDNYSENGRYHYTMSQLLVALKLSLEINDISLLEELCIYDADDLPQDKIKPYSEILKKILQKDGN